MFIDFHDAGYIFIQTGFPFWFNHRSAILNGENELQMNLSVGVCHGGKISDKIMSVYYGECFVPTGRDTLVQLFATDISSLRDRLRFIG